MEARLDGRAILVTGGTQGVGAAIARLAAESGAEAVAILGRDRTKAEGELAALRAAGAEAHFIAADLADPEAPGRAAAEAVGRLGRIDGLVNAAGITDRGNFLDADLSLWDRLFAVNARAPFFLMQGAIRDMTGRKAPGAIVNILSMNAHCGIPELAVYSATKGALATLTKNAANAHLRDGIRVNGIMMGWAATPAEREMQARTLGKGEGWEAEVAKAMPLGRLLSVEEVARLAVFLLSDVSGLMTGTLTDLEQRVTGAP